MRAGELLQRWCRRHRARSAHTRRQTRLETTRRTRQIRITRQRLRHRRRRSRRRILQRTPAQRIQTGRHLRRPYRAHAAHARAHPAARIAHLGYSCRRRDGTGQGRHGSLDLASYWRWCVRKLVAGGCVIHLDHFVSDSRLVTLEVFIPGPLGVAYRVRRRPQVAVGFLSRLVHGRFVFGGCWPCLCSVPRAVLARHRGRWRGRGDVSQCDGLCCCRFCFVWGNRERCLGRLCCLPSLLSGIPDAR